MEIVMVNGQSKSLNRSNHTHSQIAEEAGIEHRDTGIYSPRSILDYSRFLEINPESTCSTTELLLHFIRWEKVV